MSINLDKVELKTDDEKAALKLLKKNKKFTEYIADAVKNRETAAADNVKKEYEPKLKKATDKVDEFRDTNLKLKKDNEAFDGIDPEEYKRLKAVGSDAEKAAKALEDEQKRGQVEIENRDQQIKLKDDALSALKQEYETAQKDAEVLNFRNNVQLNIIRYEQENPQKKLAAGAAELLAKEIESNSSLSDEGSRTMLKDGQPFITDKGAGEMTDWIGSVATEKYPYMFQQPKGGGASGGTGAGGDKTITRQAFDAIEDPGEKAKVATSGTTIID